MAVIVLASASGSPGVSTTALGLTLNWHRPVLLVDADPTGSSSVFAGYFQGAQEPTGGLINLALSLREGTLADALPRETLLLDPEAPAERSAWFLPGIRAHEQAPSLLPLWEPLTEQLRALDRNGQDVIVDAGRLGLAGWPQPLIAASDLTLLDTALIPHGRSVFDQTIMGASLDHALWFHRPFRADEWLLYAQDSPNLHGARGFARGLIFAADGTLVASVAQEGLLRLRRPQGAPA